jgi:hypothetical protein
VGQDTESGVFFVCGGLDSPLNPPILGDFELGGSDWIVGIYQIKRQLKLFKTCKL